MLSSSATRVAIGVAAVRTGRSKEMFGKLQCSLLPWDAMGDTRGRGELGSMRDVPVIVADQRVAVRKARSKAELCGDLVDRDEALLRSGLVDPAVQRGHPQRCQQPQHQDGRFRR